MKKAITTALLASSMILNTSAFASHNYLSSTDEIMKEYDIGEVIVIKENPTTSEINKVMGEDIFLYGNTLYQAFSSSAFLQQYEAKKTQLAELTVNMFTDLESIQWYNEYITMPVYFNVLNGYEDGTLKPNGQVTCAEVAKIVATAYETGITNGGGLENEDMTYKWYANAYRAVGNIFTYEKSTLMTDAYMNSNMYRCEIAFVLANACDDGTLKNYIAKAQTGDLSSMAGYVDFHNVVNVSRDLETERQAIANGQIPARFAGAMMYLKDKGIMIGDGAGHISPLATVSRAEVFKLIQETCKATSNFVSGAFAGSEGYANKSEVATPDPSQTITTIRSGVYLDGSGEFHSVNENAAKAEGQKPGDTGYVTDSTKKLWTEMQTRKNIKVSYEDTQRPKLKAGDIFVAKDGTEYVLENSNCLMPDGTPVVGVGLPVALDLGRSYTVFGRVETVTDGFITDSSAFGWQSSTKNTHSSKYIVHTTGEGHWEFEWSAIKKATNPNKNNTPGTDGQISADGYWKYNGTLQEWGWIVR